MENARRVIYVPRGAAGGKFGGYKTLNDFLDKLTINGEVGTNEAGIDQFIENIYTVATAEAPLSYDPTTAPDRTVSGAAGGASGAAVARASQRRGGGGKARKTRKLKGGRRNKYCEPKKCYTYCAQSVGKRRTRKRKKCAPKKSKKGYCYQRVSKDGYKYCYWNKGGPKGKCKTKKAKKVYLYNRV